MKASGDPLGVDCCDSPEDVDESGDNHGFIFMLKPTAVYASENTKKGLYGPVPGVGIKMPERKAINEMVFHTDSLEVVGFLSPMAYLGSLFQDTVNGRERGTSIKVKPNKSCGHEPGI